jgi:ATPase subunit of ABC transporter with duplicated ATPase domains
VGHIEAVKLGHQLPDGRGLFQDVSFRVGDGAKVALVGPNGAGKTTLMRMIAGDLSPKTGTVTSSGGLGVMRQFVGSVRDDSTVGDLLVSVAPPRVRTAAAELDTAELAMMERDDEPTQLRYAHALVDWGDAGGYAAEVLWDTCTVAALGVPYDRAQYRDVRTLSGGEQKRLVLEALLRGPDEVLLLDEPDNYLDVPTKQWLEHTLQETQKTIFFVSHDRELLNRVATRIVTIEGGRSWVHGGGFATYHEARKERHERLDELLRRWEEEHERLKQLVRTLQQQAAISPDMASKYHAMCTRLEKFEEKGPPEAPPPKQRVKMRLAGGRTGVRAITCERLELTGLMRPFDLEVFYGERVAVLGSNGSGKSYFLRLLGGGTVPFTGLWKLGARVVPGHFAQTHDHPELVGRTLVDVLWTEHALQRGPAISALRRYELSGQADQTFESLSGGQQARLQILQLELGGSTLLLLDEPTDNLDLASAEALEEGLAQYAGTVVAVTHDRWFARSFDRYLIFGADGAVYESLEPVWDEGRVNRLR